MTTIEETISSAFDGLDTKHTRTLNLLTTLGKLVIPKGISKWNLCVDSNTPYAQGVWIPMIPENYTCLASFEVENNDGFLKVREI